MVKHADTDIPSTQQRRRVPSLSGLKRATRFASPERVVQRDLVGSPMSHKHVDDESPSYQETSSQRKHAKVTFVSTSWRWMLIIWLMNDEDFLQEVCHRGPCKIALQALRARWVSNPFNTDWTVERLLFHSCGSDPIVVVIWFRF